MPIDDRLQFEDSTGAAQGRRFAPGDLRRLWERPNEEEPRLAGCLHPVGATTCLLPGQREIPTYLRGECHFNMCVWAEVGGLFFFFLIAPSKFLSRALGNGGDDCIYTIYFFL